MRISALIGCLLATLCSTGYAHDYFYLKAKHSGKCLHQHGATHRNGDNITQWQCVNQPNVKLEKIQVPGLPGQRGYFYLKFKHSEKCVHLHGAAAANGTNITQWSCIPQPNVMWRQTPAGGGYFYLRSAQNNKCLHQHGGTQSNGGNITLWDCVNQPNVQWKFVRAPR